MHYIISLTGYHVIIYKITSMFFFLHPMFYLLGRLLEVLDFFAFPLVGVLFERMYLRASALGSMPAGEPARPGL